MASALSLRDNTRSLGVVPLLISDIDEIFAEMAALGHRMFIVMGLRTRAQQQALYAQGRTTPGPIVTMKDGVAHPSNHQAKLDGYGHAVDCAFLNVPDPFAESLPWEVYGLKVEAHGLVWGGRWPGLVDRPHAELPYPVLSQGPHGNPKPTLDSPQGNSGS